MSSTKIRCDFNEISQVIKIFKTQDSTLTQMTKRLASAKETLSGGDWIGRGAKRFYAEMDQDILPSLQRLARAMEGGAGNLQKSHKVMSQAEQESTNVFKAAPTGAEPTGPGSGDEVQTASSAEPTGPGSGDEVQTSSTAEPTGPGSGDEVQTSSSAEPTGPGSGDEVQTASSAEPTGPGSGDEVPTSSSAEPTGPGSGDEVQTASSAEPRGPGSGEEVPGA
jgi:WXG100 family type VII secretion target